MTPTHPRNERSFGFKEVMPALANADLPWYGGMIERSSENGMTVSYGKELTPDQIREFWPAALEAEGWKVKEPSLSGNGRLDALLELPDGRGGTLTIRPEGTVWWVILIIND